MDLDPLRCYRSLFGLPPADERLDPVLTTAVERFCALTDSLGLRGTLFAVGDTLAELDHAAALRAALAAGHELGCHTWSHRYDLSRLGPAEVDAEIGRGLDACERQVGVRPVGFRAPGYLLGPVILERLARFGLAYDSSMLPAPIYQAAKAVAWLGLKVAGRPSAAVLGDPREALGPAEPFRPEPERPWRKGASPIQELPMSRIGPLPLTGGLLALAGRRAAGLLARAAARAEWVQLELHGVDLLDIATDGLDPALAAQPDLRIPWQRKAASIKAFVAQVMASHRAMRLDEVATSQI
jgi:hypothetical protein